MFCAHQPASQPPNRSIARKAADTRNHLLITMISAKTERFLSRLGFLLRLAISNRVKQWEKL
jgi:hypothetical protein